MTTASKPGTPIYHVHSGHLITAIYDGNEPMYPDYIRVYNTKTFGREYWHSPRANYFDTPKEAYQSYQDKLQADRQYILSRAKAQLGDLRADTKRIQAIIDNL